MSRDCHCGSKHCVACTSDQRRFLRKGETAAEWLRRIRPVQLCGIGMRALFTMNELHILRDRFLDLESSLEEARGRLRLVAQILIEQVGASGPTNAEEAAERTLIKLADAERTVAELESSLANCEKANRVGTEMFTERNATCRKMAERAQTAERQRDEALETVAAFEALIEWVHRHPSRSLTTTDDGGIAACTGVEAEASHVTAAAGTAQQLADELGLVWRKKP